MLMLILVIVGGVLLWKWFRNTKSITLPTTSGGTADIDVHAAWQIWQNEIAKQAREEELKLLAQIQAHDAIQTRVVQATKVTAATGIDLSAAPAPKA